MIKWLLIAVVVILFLSLCFDWGLVPPCLFYKLTGLHCPACGMTRVAKAVLRFDLMAAFQHNPLVILVSPVLFTWLGLEVTRSFLNKPSWYKPSARACYIILAVIMVYWVARNIPHPVFDLLGP